MKEVQFKTYINTIERKGYLKYEYNPFHNYLTNVNLYEISTDVGDVLVPDGKAVKKSTGEILIQKNNKWVDKNGNIINDSDVLLINSESNLYAVGGSLIDFTTDLLNFDLKHPVDITVQPSYDGSVNLILNDGKNIPRLINSRFSAREKNTYEIVDRIGENDTNIYNSDDFDKDTSLYFRYSSSPKIRFVKHIGGTLPVGQYCFYFTYCDADDNESDIIAESGLIPVFIGTNKDPFSIDGGIKNQNSNKGIAIELSNLDKSYNYIKIYQFRYFADYLQNRVYECKKFYNKYPLIGLSLFLSLSITGNEDGEMIDPNILNISTFNPKSVLALAQCKNMLFFGNIVKNIDNYKELTDCALRIFPCIKKLEISDIDYNYHNSKGEYAYYDVNNMYNKVGYFPGEYYRFGVVFIYANGTLSNVYNTFGYNYTGTDPKYEAGKIYDTDGDIINRKYINFDDEGFIIDNEGIYLLMYRYNAKGVLKINVEQDVHEDSIIGILFKIHLEVIEHLKTLNVVGMFFVRQKRIPNILAQCYLLPMDRVLNAPVIEINISSNTKKYISESFLELNSSQRTVTNDYSKRLIQDSNEGKYISQVAYAAICPDFLLNQPYYNQIFNGSKFKLLKISENTELYRDLKNERFYKQNTGSYDLNNEKQQVKICTVTEDVPTVAIEKCKYKLNIGQAEEVYRFGFAKRDSSSDTNYYEKTNLVRGVYSPYLAIYSENELKTGCLYNIFIDEELDDERLFLDRMNSKDPFYAISERNNFEDLVLIEEQSNIFYTDLCYRGDCYFNTFTYRLNRNFNDPSLPNNDEIIQEDTWKEHYKIDDEDDKKDKKKNWEKISRSDVNAVKLGSWITIKCRSSMNYALRSNDGSFVSENAIMGSERSFYPRSSLLEAGENKRPDSYLYNDAYRATLGFKCYFTLDNVNYLKNNFSNRILYSSISILDSYKNNFRHSLTTYFRDYSQEYGSILKLVGFEGYLLVVFEHAICIAVINERILAGQSDGEPVFINTHNVLPEELTVISDTYGTQWPESVIKSEAGYVYGVDTILKKIWRVKSLQLEILSDFKVNKFLIDNITLGERETYPIVGLRNVKTHYNNNKKDVMFTFYDNVYKDEEKAWNLCFNEMLDLFITFYSWIPSYSENIDTQFFSFDRNTSKYLSLLNKCNANIPENKGILVDLPIINVGTITLNLSKEITVNLSYIPLGIGYVDQTKDGILYHESLIQEEDPDITYNLEKDHWKNYKFVSISGNKLKLTFSFSNMNKIPPVILLEITPFKDDIYFPTETVAIGINDILKNFTTDFYLHGNSGIIDCQEQLYPTHWYGKFHPFEFEFAVNDKISLLKIFTNLIIISNKAEPESFHFEIEGDNYEFSDDKRTMYFRLEATKNLYQNLGSDMLYDRKFTDVAANKYTNELYYRANLEDYTKQYNKFDKVYPIENNGLTQQVKSTIFPLYYERIDTYNDIYYKYRGMLDDIDDSGYDFKNLSGSEIVWHRRLNLLNIVTHVKNSPINIFGRLRGNSYYKEGKWNILIPSISFMLKNEDVWDSTNFLSGYNDSPVNYLGLLNIPPLVINSNYIPNDLESTNITYDELPNIYKKNGKYDTLWPRYINNAYKWTARKETKIRDKWIKIRVRYSGKNLAVIHSLVTLYNVSYS